jgi:hypothetical protein
MINVIPLHSSPLSRPLVRRLAMAAAIVVLGVAASAALAGECPADKRVADGQGQKPGPTAPVGVR